MGLIDRFKRAVNVFAREPTRRDYYDTGPGYSYRPDRVRFSRGNERSIVKRLQSLQMKSCQNVCRRKRRRSTNYRY